MLHVLCWAGFGLIVAAFSWLLRPRPHPLNPLPMLLLCIAGALFGGFVSWILWDFPGEADYPGEQWSTPALVSDCVAACGALAALSLAMGVVMLGGRNHFDRSNL